MARKLQKGSRVEITEGPSAGVCGQIFWVGASRYGDGQRFGVRGDDGESRWVDDTEVALTNKPIPEELLGPTFSKGDRVSFVINGQQGTGTVFWIGRSRSGPGQRLGVRGDDGDGQDDAIWLDARFARPLDSAAA